MSDICEGSGATVYPSTRRDFSGRVWCGWCEQFVPTVNVSDPYRPERRDAHKASSPDITKGGMQ